MRAGVALLVVLTLGCSSTVHRIGGEVKTPAGKAETPCEESAWYVLTPTRVDPVYGDAKTAKPERQGLGLYRIGSKSPVSIPAASVDLGPDPMLERHSKAVEDYDRDSMLATAFTGAGLVALTLGIVTFVTAFETTHSAGGEEEQRINSGRAYTGAIVGGLGIGLSVTGLVFNPTQAQRANAEAARYVFLEPDDDPDKVIDMVADHNREVSKSCKRLGGSAAAKDDDEEAEEESENEVADDEDTEDIDLDDEETEDVDLGDEDSASDEDEDY